MALEQITGVCKLPFMKRHDAVLLEQESHRIKCATCNFLNPYCLMAPPFENPAENLPKIINYCQVPLDFDHGTTTLGFKYQGGIILCADSRATSGDYVGSQHMRKIIELTDYMLGTVAGGAADCMYWDRVLTKECRLHELRYQKRLSVTASARIMANISCEYRNMGLSMGMMLAGYDYDEPKLIYVDSEGDRNSLTLYAVGSGALCALGLLDTSYKWDLSDTEAYDLARRCIYHATCTDAYSGGIVRLYHLKKEGWKVISNTDCLDLHKLYAKEKEEGNIWDTIKRVIDFKLFFRTY